MVPGGQQGLIRALRTWLLGESKAREAEDSCGFSITGLERGEADAAEERVRALASMGEEDLRRMWRLLRGEAAPANPSVADLLASLREKREAPESLADQLVRDTLPDAEYEALRRDGYLDVPSSTDENRRYRVFGQAGSYRQTQMWQRGENGEWGPLEALCVVGSGSEAIPAGDLFLTHYLLLKTDEARFLKTANHFPMANQSPAVNREERDWRNWERGGRYQTTALTTVCWPAHVAHTTQLT